MTVSIDRLKPAYAMSNDIEENPISDEQQERDILKIGQAPVQQTVLANSTESFSNLVDPQHYRHKSTAGMTS